MITATAPARVDLAGGTLDIWPLCHLLERPGLTVNCAIDRRARAEVGARTDGLVVVESVDRNERVSLPANALRHDRLGIGTRLAAALAPGRALDIRLESRVPPGSGLGGSSALSVALATALAAFVGEDLAGGPLREFVQTIETRLLGVPTGYQDYYPAIVGGVNAIEATERGVAVTPIPGAADLLARHLVVLDTGIEHASGMNNWEVVRRFLDGDAATRRNLNRVNECSYAMRDALAAGDLAATVEALDAEWRARRALAPVVSNARIEQCIADARRKGALAAKICGAGGGGCLALLVEDAGGFPGGLPFRPDACGVRAEGEA